MELGVSLFLLVLINLLMTLGRQQKRVWVRWILSSVSLILLIVALLFILRMFM
ncbi:hypothetical protein EDC32_1011021 [Laceyella sacchari]|jgi:hypothetical protein|nr:hypothetical protein EDC32_1011021 [Laceyella sacchari]